MGLLRCVMLAREELLRTVARELLQHPSIDVNAAGAEGRTALHLAARLGNMGCMPGIPLPVLTACTGGN